MANSGQRADATPIVLRIKLRYDDEDLFVSRLAHYINRAGMFLRSPRPKAIGKRLIILFKLANGASVLECEGHVRWIRPADGSQGPSGMGVEFSRLSPETRPIMARILEERTKLNYEDSSEIPFSPEGFSLNPESATEHAASARSGAPAPSQAAPMARAPRAETVVDESLAAVAAAAVMAVADEVAATVGRAADSSTAASRTDDRSADAASRDHDNNNNARPSARTGKHNGRPAVSELLARAQRQAAAPNALPNVLIDNNSDAELEALLEADMPDLARVLARARILASAAVDGSGRMELDRELEALLDPPPAVQVSVNAADAGRALSMLSGGARSERVSSGGAAVEPQRGPAPEAEPQQARPRAASIPLGIHDLSAPEIHVIPPPPGSPQSPRSPANLAPGPAENRAIPLSALAGPGPGHDPEFAALPTTGNIPLSELGPPIPMLGRMASEREYDDDDFPDIETVDHDLTPSFLDVGTMGSLGESPPVADLADAVLDSDLPSIPAVAQPESGLDDQAPAVGDDADADLDSILDSALSTDRPADGEDLDIDSMLDSALSDAQAHGRGEDSDIDSMLDAVLDAPIREASNRGREPAQAVAPDESGSLVLDPDLGDSAILEVRDLSNPSTELPPPSTGLPPPSTGLPPPSTELPPPSPKLPPPSPQLPPNPTALRDSALDLDDDFGPSGLELALQEDRFIEATLGSAPQIIAPSDDSGNPAESTMVMADVNPDLLGMGAAGAFDEADMSRRSMSMEFDARALDADSMMSADLDALDREPYPTSHSPFADADDATRPGFDEPVEPRKPPLRAPPRTESVPALRDGVGVRPGPGPVVDDDLDEIIDDLDELMVVEDEVDQDFPPLATPLPAPIIRDDAPDMSPEEFEALSASHHAAHAMAAGDHGAGDHGTGDHGADGEGAEGSEGDDDDGRPKKRGFFRRLFNK